MSTRIYGLSGSGMDVDQMVKDLMKAQRSSYDKLWQKKTQTEWAKEDYNTIYSLAEKFRNTTIFNFRKSSSYQPKGVSSSNESVLTATANADAANISHSILVNQLADGVKLSSSAGINGTNITLATSGYTSGTSPVELFKINGKSVQLTINDQTNLNDVAKAINDSGAGVKANYDATLDRFYLYSNNSGSTASINFAGSSDTGLDFLYNTLKLDTQNNTVSTMGMQSLGDLGMAGTDTISAKFGISTSFSLNISGSSVQIDPTDTLDTVLAKINNEAAKVNPANATAATYDGKKVTIKAADAASGFSISAAAGDLVARDFLTNKLQLGQIGQDAKINLDGVDLTQASNSFTISGVSYKLKSVSTVAATVNIQADIDKTIENVKAFIEDYNTFIGAINTELAEKKYKDFMPLTDDQKKDMKDSEIEAWEKKARSGLLRNDSNLTNMITNLRSSFSTQISGLKGDYKSASSIGITTGSYINEDGKFVADYNNSNKLHVDENKLRKALAEDPDIVYKIFGTSGDSYQTKGVANRLYDQMYTSLGKFKEYAGYPGAVDINSSLAKRISNYNDQLDSMDERLNNLQERYYKQFDAMESALNILNKQSSWISQMFGAKG